MQRTFSIIDYKKNYGHARYYVVAGTGVPYDDDQKYGTDDIDTLITALRVWLGGNKKRGGKNAKED